MTSSGSLSQLGLKQLSVCLVDFRNTPTGLTPAVRPEPKDSPDLVNRKRSPGLNGQPVHQAAEQSNANIDPASIKEEELGCFENPQQTNAELDQQPGCSFKEAEAWECYGKGDSCEETKAEDSDELQPRHAGAAGTLLVIREDGGRSDGVTSLVQDYKLSESLTGGAPSGSEGRREERDREGARSPNSPSDDVAVPERRGAEAREQTGHSHVSQSGVGDEGKAKKKKQKRVFEGRRHECEHCGKSFARKSNVVRHQRNHCSTTRNTLSESESEQTEQVTKKKNKEEKLRSEAPRERRHACKQCDKKFYLLQTLRQHLLTHTGEKPYSCQRCGKQFGREGTLKEHQVIHTGEKEFTCEQCGKTCARRGDLKIHMLSHSEERPYNCSRCAKSFKHQAKLKEHERVHTGERPYQCTLCPKRFRTHVSLAVHQYTHSGEKPLKCTICSKAFNNRTNLKKHQMIHNGEKPYSCSHCGKSCRLLQHLIFHERSHTGEKPYKCDKCGKGYAYPSGLKTHLAYHVEKPPGCAMCGRDFTELTKVNSHRCCETVEKPHCCSQCGKCFSQSVSLRKHQLIHSGGKPYICNSCGKQFNDKSNLSKHLRIHTGEKPFECEHCKRGFRLLQHLTHHRLTHKNS